MKKSIAGVFINNPDFKDWSNDIPDDWYIHNKNQKEIINIDNVIVRRVYHFNILGVRFTIKGRNLIKVKKGKKYIVEKTYNKIWKIKKN